MARHVRRNEQTDDHDRSVTCKVFVRIVALGMAGASDDGCRSGKARPISRTHARAQDATPLRHEADAALAIGGSTVGARGSDVRGTACSSGLH